MDACIEALNKRIAALEVQVQEQQEFNERLRFSIEEFERIVEKFSEICDFELELHKAKLKG